MSTEDQPGINQPDKKVIGNLFGKVEKVRLSVAERQRLSQSRKIAVEALDELTTGPHQNSLATFTADGGSILDLTALKPGTVIRIKMVDKFLTDQNNKYPNLKPLSIVPQFSWIVISEAKGLRDVFWVGRKHLAFSYPVLEHTSGDQLIKQEYWETPSPNSKLPPRVGEPANSFHLIHSPFRGIAIPVSDLLTELLPDDWYSRGFAQNKYVAQADTMRIGHPISIKERAPTPIRVFKPSLLSTPTFSTKADG